MNQTQTKRVKFWTRITRERSEEWVLIEGRDDSNVPVAAWKTFNRIFWKWRNEGSFFPLDELDAYQIGAAAMVRAAEQPPADLHVRFTTYLVTAALHGILKYKQRRVEPARADYRALFDGARVRHDGNDASARGEDRDDREWTAGAGGTLDVRAFTEALPCLHAADARHTARLAHETVLETLAKLDDDAQRGLRAWLAADGIWIDAARLYNPRGSVQGYVYRFKHLWAKAFRAACDWRM